MDKAAEILLGRQWDPQRVAKSFAAAAADYDAVAVLQQQTGDELLSRLDLLKATPSRVLDLGAGTGRQTAMLQQRYPKAEIIALDIAPAMLKQAQKRMQATGWKRLKRQRMHYCNGNAEALPLADNSVDLVYTNLCLQWCDPRRSFAEIQRVLRPDGALMFTTLGSQTLNELRQAWATVDDYPHVNTFIDMHDVGEAMQYAGLAQPVLDVDRYTLTYETAMDLMRDLKTLGARNVNNARRRGLTGRKALKQVAMGYEPYRKNDVLPATYEVVFGHAFGGTPPRTAQPENGDISIPVSAITRWKKS